MIYFSLSSASKNYQLSLWLTEAQLTSVAWAHPREPGPCVRPPPSSSSPLSLHLLWLLVREIVSGSQTFTGYKRELKAIN